VGGNAIRTTDITANDNTVCFACHTAASTSFPALEAQREAVTGYLTDGTWPGMAAYSTAYTAVTHTGNGHLTADGGVAGTALPGYVAGDCKVCHDVHGTANTYDELRLGFGDQDYTLCLDCHDADGPAGADIERFYPAATGGSNAGDRSGHRIVSSAPGAMLVAGEALPCYDCHNPHGSESAYMLQVGSVGDDTGEINLTTPLGVRNFCFTCHTTADGSRGYNGSGMVVI
jgi:predicted CXXCH cytochrome family protein